MTLVIWYEGQRIGRIKLSNGVLTGSSWAVQEICRVFTGRAGGDAAAAYDRLSGYGNGYIEIVPATPLAREHRDRRLW